MIDTPFTPGQREEALTWFKENSPGIKAMLEGVSFNLETKILIFIDLYFKLKKVDIALDANQFVVGVEYIDSNKVLEGKEKIKFTLHNPTRFGKARENYFAHQIMLELIKRTKD